MDSEWWKTPRFVYGKVPERFRKVLGKTGKVRNFLEGGGTGQPWAGPTTRAAPEPPGGPSRVKWGREGFLLPPIGLEREGISSSFSFLRCVLVPSIFGQ